jgi:tRNA(Phe) wybutosine-synthesizing methylase Tyw3
MTKYFEKIVNIETNEEILRPLNEDETAIVDENALAAIEIANEKAKQQAADAEAKVAILNKLGITEDEAKLLIG